MDCQDEGEIFNLGYLAGAEPREKRIAELEDKLANADYQLEGRDIKIKELETRCNELFLQTCEQVEKIKELKDDNKVMADNYSKMEQKFYDNLTKAKELLKRYVPYRQITDSKAYKDLADETEQFISEMKK